MTRLRDRIAAIEASQWIGAGVALAAVLFIASLFFIEALYGYWKPEPEIVYFQNWDETRSYEDALQLQEQEVRIQSEADRIADELAAEAMAGLEAEGDVPATTADVPAVEAQAETPAE